MRRLLNLEHLSLSPDLPHHLDRHFYILASTESSLSLAIKVSSKMAVMK